MAHFQIFLIQHLIENLENSVTYQLFVSVRDTLFNESSLEQFGGNTTPTMDLIGIFLLMGVMKVLIITDPSRNIHAINISKDNDSIYVLEGIFENINC